MSASFETAICGAPKTFCGFPGGIKQFRWLSLRFVCWFYDGNTKRLTKSGLMEKQGIKPATPGLQDIGLSPTPWQACEASIMVARQLKIVSQIDAFTISATMNLLFVTMNLLYVFKNLVCLIVFLKGIFDIY